MDEVRRKRQVEEAYEAFGIEHKGRISRESKLPDWTKKPIEKDMPLAEPSPELLRKLSGHN